MISSCTKHSRSAQRRPWRSFSSTACAVARAVISLGLEQLRHGRAEHILAAGMLYGERVDRGADPCGVETFVGLGWACVTTLSIIYPDIGPRQRCHGILITVGAMLDFAILQARRFSFAGMSVGYFRIGTRLNHLRSNGFLKSRELPRLMKGGDIRAYLSLHPTELQFTWSSELDAANSAPPRPRSRSATNPILRPRSSRSRPEARSKTKASPARSRPDAPSRSPACIPPQAAPELSFAPATCCSKRWSPAPA